MRKIITTIIAASLALAGTNAFAQNLVAEVGFGLSDTRFDYTLGHVNADLYGGTLGLSYEIPLVEGTVGFAPGIQFGYFTKGNVNIYGYDNISFTETYLAVPLDFNLKFNISEDMKFLVFAGPTLDLGLTSRIKEKNTSMEYDIYSGKLSEYTKYSRFDVLLGGGLGLDVMDAVRFSIRYDYGVINRNGGNLTSGVLKIHRSQLKLGVGFMF
ncbi:MAG: PorT family protein [Bacteroidales bacterium]|nr:PorT family protein [Bacteroidales bacterium]